MRSSVALLTVTFGTLVVLAPRVAAADNFAPIAKITATPGQGFVGDAIQLSSAASIDPDNAPQPLTYQWDFGDGTTSTQASPSHVRRSRAMRQST